MSVIIHPYSTEESMIDAEENNRLQFIVKTNATKHDVKRDVEGIYGVKIISVKTMITPRNEKKAIVTLSQDDNAIDIATELGIF